MTPSKADAPPAPEAPKVDQPAVWAKSLKTNPVFFAAASASNKWDRDPGLQMTQEAFEQFIEQAKEIGA